ncbi:right-handed parallel beta-helix repeat-containing protein [Pleomorphovibrio marinus]|uniref:right-handed parallel beta-helix repeat-containing protein n=1 Tax=Pleomorphovibrio marinus TaxID=2164132 RepID=UPI000E0B2F8E|nr:right-handed parallel beta-helix repeat-containing protein [Pleomorphovibrio marinus]
MRTIKLIVCFIFALLANFSLEAKEIWVTKNGDDLQEGNKETPLASIEMALRKAREWRRLDTHPSEEPIYIMVGEGIYYLDKPILVRPEDSGTSQSPTIIKSATSNHSELSAGKPVEGWQKSRGNLAGFPRVSRGKLWEAPIPKTGGKHLQFRQLWINGEKANRASNLDEESLSRILDLDKEVQEMYIPHPNFEWEEGEELEFVIHQWWAIANLRVKSMEREGNRTKLTFYQPESQIEFEHPWPAPFLDKEEEYQGNSAFFFVGAKSLLNNPGEWYADYASGKIYYWPKEDQDMAAAKAVVPFLENVVDLRGTRENPVNHVYFEGLKFSHGTWLRPSREGHVPLQAGWSILEAYSLPEPGTPDKEWLENQAWIERQPAAFEVRYATDLKIERCLFTHHAATGLDLVEGVSNTLVRGNVFMDIGGTGIQAGFFGGPEYEAHLPYEPSDRRELVGHVKIYNNLITDATNEDWGCVGISVGFAHDVDITHNEVREVNYSGICVGWGWTRTISAAKNNRVHANKIHRFAKQMYDVGGIYTLSAQPNMEISENSIFDLMDAPYAHMPHHHQYIYLDEGSSYIRIENNWTEKDKFFSNRPGPGVHWENNGPEVEMEIKNKAGIEDGYKDILDYVPSP